MENTQHSHSEAGEPKAHLVLTKPIGMEENGRHKAVRVHGYLCPPAEPGQKADIRKCVLQASMLITPDVFETRPHTPAGAQGTGQGGHEASSPEQKTPQLEAACAQPGLIGPSPKDQAGIRRLEVQAKRQHLASTPAQALLALGLGLGAAVIVGGLVSWARNFKERG